MKVKLSRNQWKNIGVKAGWVKKSQNMTEKMDSFFSPSIKLVRRKINGHIISGKWYVDLVRQLPLARQFMEEAGIKYNFGAVIEDANLDAFTSSASKHGYSVETVGE